MFSLRISQWNAEWRSRVDTVDCVVCGARQKVFDKADAFIHWPTCSQAGHEAYPWRDLHEIMESAVTLSKTRRVEASPLVQMDADAGASLDPFRQADNHGRSNGKG